MVNYKIHRIQIKNSDVSVEVQNLLISAGLKWNISKEPRVEHPYGYPITLFIRWEDKEFFCGYDSYAENINVDELRDLVVLKRNDVKDANYTYCGNPVLKLETQDYKVWDENKQAWLEHIGSQTDLRRGLKAIPKRPESATGRFDENGEHHLTFSNGAEEKDPALISGAEALRVLADGKEVEASTECSPTIWEDAANYSANEFLAEETAETEDYCSMKLFFRLKPQTIKLELELPKPFEPKDGEVYYYLKPSNAWGFGCGEWGDDSMQNEYIQYGAWPTKEDVLKVVEQLRKIRGTNS